MFEDDEDDEDDDQEWDDDSDDSETTTECPYCHREIYDDAERCPECGNYLSRTDRPLNRPIWWVVGVLVCLGIVALWQIR